MNNKFLLKAKSVKNNEFYTTLEHMEDLFETPNNLTEVLKDKIIYCPCDTEKSQIVKYLKSHQNELKIKEIIYTSDDYYSHEELYDKADIVFTNPPFTGLRAYIKWLESKNKHFILFWSWNSVFCYDTFFENILSRKWKIISSDKFQNIFYDTD